MSKKVRIFGKTEYHYDKKDDLTDESCWKKREDLFYMSYETLDIEYDNKIKAVKKIEEMFNLTRAFGEKEKLELKYDPENEIVYVYVNNIYQRRINTTLDSVGALIYDVVKEIYQIYF